MRLADVPWTDLETVETDRALIPVGSTEQHGPHAPLGTDTITATAVAEAGADAMTDEVVIAPPIPVGIAEEHRSFTGTLWVSPDTFRAYVYEYVESLTHHGFDRVVLVNGHGGNAAALREVAARLTRDEIATVVPFTWFDAVDTELPMGHGGARETSLLQSVHPDLVHDERCADAAANASDQWGEWQSGTNIAYDVEEFTENGVVGDPTLADASHGDELLTDAAEALADLVSALPAPGEITQ